MKAEEREPTLRNQLLALQRQNADLLARSTDLLISAIGNVERLSDETLNRLLRGMKQSQKGDSQ